MKCIVWDASMRTTQRWLMLTVSQSVTSSLMRCRCQLPCHSWPRVGVFHLLRNFHWQPSHHFSPPLQPPSHRWDSNLKACQRDFFQSFSVAVNGQFMSVKHYSVTVTDKESEENFGSSYCAYSLLFFFVCFFYLLPDLNLCGFYLWCQKFGNCQINRCSPCFSQNCLSQWYVNCVHFRKVNIWYF